MKFYYRDNELALLKAIETQSQQAAQMTFVVGRRRIGKTSLLIKAYETDRPLYFFVGRKNEALLCTEFLEEIKKQLNVPLFGEFRNFKEVFGLLMELSGRSHFTLIIDEFQEFMSVNPSVYSDMQQIWDRNKDQSKINLILCGSVYSMMTRIFENSGEPLFGRATHRIHLKALDVVTLTEILDDYVPHHTQEDVLAFYMFTGGVAKYVELLVQAGAFTLSSILEEVLHENSLFLDEGKNVLIDEFGKDYGNYFSILSLIASGKTSRVEIESILEMQTGGFLNRLENQHHLIRKVRPILAKPNSRTVKYTIDDNFLKFWFRYIYKHQSAVEIGNFEFMKKVILDNYTTYSGQILEKYFIEKLKTEKIYNIIGTYWEKQNQNEIDIVAVNDTRKKVLFAEVKRNSSKINLDALRRKSRNLQSQFTDYEFDFIGFSLEDVG